MVPHPGGRLPQKAGAGPGLFLPVHRDPQPHYTMFLLRFHLGEGREGGLSSSGRNLVGPKTLPTPHQ